MINISSTNKKFKKHESTVRATAKQVFTFLRIKNPTLNFFLIENAKMKSLNEKFRGKDKITNVLSFKEPKNFPHPELGKNSNMLGEIYLAPDYIEQKKDNIIHLTIHGILHLLGYTHGKSRDRIRMETVERDLLQQIQKTTE